VKTRSALAQRLVKNRLIYIMLLPGMAYFVIFKYVPMWGLLIAFQDYLPFLGVMGSKWVGMKHFDTLFGDPIFWVLLRNTFVLAFYNLFFFFPLPILIALMLNELRSKLYKGFIQTLIYVPHFVSWVVVIGIVYLFLTTEDGVINDVLVQLGGQKVNFLLSKEWLRPLIIMEMIWKETGWGTIIFLAALAGVDPQLYEAARMDGANRIRQLWHVTLPAIRNTIIILFILRLGHFLDTGFEQIYLMLNAMNRDVGEVFDTYVYTVGIQQGQFSYTAAVGLFKSLVGMVLVISSNYLAKKFGEEGVY
jgi:putative aldouronate transport system permease protein